MVVPCARVMDTTVRDGALLAAHGAVAGWASGGTIHQRLRRAAAPQASQWRDRSGGSGPEHDPCPVQRCRMQTMGMRSVLCLCTMPCVVHAGASLACVSHGSRSRVNTVTMPSRHPTTSRCYDRVGKTAGAFLQHEVCWAPARDLTSCLLSP